MSEKFEYWKSKKDGMWYFHLKAPNGEVIVDSEGYTTKDNCVFGIESVKKNAPTAFVDEIEDQNF
jgi:uncharacterized protein YegP (UPF0339 family)